MLSYNTLHTSIMWGTGTFFVCCVLFSIVESVRVSCENHSWQAPTRPLSSSRPRLQRRSRARWRHALWRARRIGSRSRSAAAPHSRPTCSRCCPTPCASCCLSPPNADTAAHWPDTACFVSPHYLLSFVVLHMSMMSYTVLQYCIYLYIQYTVLAIY